MTATEPAGGDGRGSSSVQVIARVADILRALESEPEGLSLAQIASRVGLPRSTVHRLTVGLAAEGFVIPASPTGRLRLGPALARLGAASRRELRQELAPFLRRLAEEVGETVDLAVLDRGQVRFIDQISGAHRLRAVSSVGDAFPLHCSANGKALLATLPRAEAERLLPARLEALTEHTVTSRQRLWQEVEEVRRTGVAFDREEHTIGICAVGTAILEGEAPRAAITIVVPTTRFTGREAHFVRSLLRIGREIDEIRAAT